MSQQQASHDPVTFYVGCGAASDICLVVYDPDTQTLALRQRTHLPDVTKAGGSLPLCISADQHYLYAASRGTPLLAARYAIDATTRELAFMDSRSLSASMAYIALSATGDYLFGASYGEHLIAADSLPSTGTASFSSHQFATQPHAHAVMQDTHGKHIVATSLGGDLLYCLNFDPVHGFQTVDHYRFPDGTGPRHVVFNAEGDRIYVLGELDGSITLLDYDSASARMTFRQKVLISKGEHENYWAAELKLSADGKFLYASERNSSLLTSFSVAEEHGELTYHDECTTETQPRGFALSPCGHYLLAAGQASHHVTLYQVNTGRLEPLARLELGGSPDWVEAI